MAVLPIYGTNVANRINFKKILASFEFDEYTQHMNVSSQKTVPLKTSSLNKKSGIGSQRGTEPSQSYIYQA